MGESPPIRSNFAQSTIVLSATLAALTLLCFVLAYWTWVWFAPGAAPRTRAVEAQRHIEAAYGLYGGARRSQTAAAPTALAIRLLGVAAAAGGKSGYAIVQLDANKVLVTREGTDIAPGIRLAEVQAGQIILERNGARETLVLPDKNTRARQAGAQP
jgi:general secretion pathway protein C